MQKSSPVIQLVAARSNDDFVRKLEDLLKEANQGKVVGLIVAAHYGGAEYGYAGSGSFCDQPQLAGSALRHLWDAFFP